MGFGRDGKGGKRGLRGTFCVFLCFFLFCFVLEISTYPHFFLTQADSQRSDGLLE